MSDHHHRNDVDRRRAQQRRPAIPDVYMPAMPPLALMQAIGRRIAAWRRRRALLELLKLDCHLLGDIGLTREDIRRAAGGAARFRTGDGRGECG